MAKFTQDIRPTADPNYLGASKEPDRQKPNIGLGELFSNIGELGSGIVGAVDQGIKNRVKDAVYDGVDPLRDSQGVKEGAIAGVTGQPLNADKGGTPGANNPLAPTSGEEVRAPLNRTNPAITNANDSVARLTAAYQSGAIGSTQYYGQLEALTRQLRARFPGYREDVDAMIHKVTGVTPANALRASIESDLASGASAQKQAADKYETYLHQNEDKLPPGFWQLRAQGKEPSQLEVYNYVTQEKQKDYKRQAAKQELELAHAQGTFNKENGVRVLTSQLNSLFDDTLVKSTSAAGLSDIMKRVQDAQSSGKPLSPEEQQVLRAQIGQLRLKMQEAMERTINTPGASGHSYASMIGDNTEVDKARKGVMTRLDNIENALTNGDFGVLNVEANLAKARENEVYARLMGDTYLSTMQGLGKINQMLPGMYINMDSKGFGAAVNGVLTAQAVKRAQGTSNGFSNQLTELKLTSPNGKVDGNTVKKAIEGAVAGVTDPTISPEYRLNHAKSLYSDKEYGLLDRIPKADQRTYVFQRMASPQVTQEMLKMKAQGGEGAKVWSDYARWATNGFAQTMKGSLDQITSSSNQSDLFTMKFDEKAGAFIPELTPKGQQFVKSSQFQNVLRTNDPVQQLKQVMGGSTWNAMEQINSNLRNMKPIWEGNGKQVGTEVNTILNGYDFDPTGNHKPEQTSVLQGLRNAVKGFFSDQEGDTEKAIRSRPKGQQRSDIDLDATVQQASYGGGTSSYRASAGDQIARAADYGRHLAKTESNPIVVAGILGNGWHESGGLIPDVWGDKGDSLGLFQFNKGGRLPPFQKWAAANGRELTDPYAQLDFVQYDLRVNHPDTYEKMQRARTPAEAAHIMMAEYERPAKGAEHADRRYGLADQAYGIISRSALASR